MGVPRDPCKALDGHNPKNCIKPNKNKGFLTLQHYVLY